MINQIRWGVPKRKKDSTEDTSTVVPRTGLNLYWKWTWSCSTVRHQSLSAKRWTPSSDSADVSMKYWRGVACRCINVNQKWSVISLPTKMSPWGDAILLQTSCYTSVLLYVWVYEPHGTQQGSNKYNGSLIAWHEWSLEYQWVNSHTGLSLLWDCPC